MINSLFIPSGLSSKYKIYSFFKRFNFLQCDGKLMMLTSLMPLIINSATSMEPAYKNYFLMLSEDIIHLLSPCFSDNEIEELHWNIIENMALKEGLFPIYDSTLAGNHQIIDLPRYIHKFGIIKGWWAMAGERSLSSIKKFKSDNGGKLIENIISKKYGAWEEERTIAAYNNNHIYLSENTGRIFHRFRNNNNLHANLFKELDDFDKYLIIVNDQNVQELKFCDYLFTMKKNINMRDIINKKYYTNFYDDNFFHNRDYGNNYNNYNNNYSIFNLYEINELIISLKDECVRICNLQEDNNIEVLKVSSLCRLYKCYNLERKKYMKFFEIKTEPTFYVWICSFINVEKGYSPEKNNVDKILNIGKTILHVMRF